MATCKNCGAKTGSGLTVLWALLGTAAAGLIGLPVLIVVALAAIAAVGSSANDEFSNVSEQLHGNPSAEFRFDHAANNAVEHLGEGHFEPAPAHEANGDFTAAQ